MNMLHFSHEAGFRILRKVFTLGFKTKTKSLQIAHCHGAGGSGYKFSRSVARRVVELVKDVWNTQNSHWRMLVFHCVYMLPTIHKSE